MCLWSFWSIRSNTAIRLAYAPHSEQGQPFERRPTEHVERDRPTSNSAARLPRPPGLNFENMEGEPEPIIEDRRHSPSSPNPLPIDGAHQRHQIHHRNIPSSHRSDVEQQRREVSQVHSHSYSTNSVQRYDTTSNGILLQANSHPNLEHQATVKEEATLDDDETLSMYTTEGGEVIAYTAQIDMDMVSSSHTYVPAQRTAEDREKKAALVCTTQMGNETASSSHSYVPVRLKLKIRLLEEAIEDWKANDSINKLKELVHYDDDNDFDYVPNWDDLMSERKRYEHYCYEMTVRRPRPFPIYGTEGLHKHNRLRLWVNLGMQGNHRTLISPGYKPITEEEDKISEPGILYSQTKSMSGSSVSGIELGGQVKECDFVVERVAEY